MATNNATQQVPEVLRDEHGRIRKGSPNPGGMTREVREARETLRQWLSEPSVREIAKASYLRQLGEGNVVILKDFMDRVLGPPKQQVELSGDSERPLLSGLLTRDELVRIAKGENT